MKDAPWFYLFLKKEKITMMQCPQVEIESPKNVTGIITPSAERKLEVQLIPIKKWLKSSLKP